jgi:hypothetical protein
LPFDKTDVAAMIAVHDLSMVLSAVADLDKQQQELVRRIEFFNNRLQTNE